MFEKDCLGGRKKTWGRLKILPFSPVRFFRTVLFSSQPENNVRLSKTQEQTIRARINSSLLYSSSGLRSSVSYGLWVPKFGNLNRRKYGLGAWPKVPLSLY